MIPTKQLKAEVEQAQRMLDALKQVHKDYLRAYETMSKNLQRWLIQRAQGQKQ